MIDIIVPVYNKEKTIKRCLDSIVEQTYDDWNCIIVNDGSPDNSEDLIALFLEDPRFVYIKKENGGVSSARNMGLNASSGEWVMFLDADDYLLPNCLELLIESAKQYDASFVTGNFYFEKANVRSLSLKNAINGIVKKPMKAHFLDLICPRCGAYICKRSFINNMRFDEKLSRYEDVALLFPLLRTCFVSSVSDPVMVYSNDDNYLSQVRTALEKDNLFYLSPKGKDFWERLFIYRFMKEAWTTYPSRRKDLFNKYGKCSLEIVLTTFISKILKLWIRIK